MSSSSQDNGLKAVNSNTSYKISPDQFERIIENLPEAQSDIIRWWYFHGKEQFLSLRDLATRAGVSSTTLSRVFSGQYGAGLDKLCDTLSKARETAALSIDNPDFIMTSLARRMFPIFDSTRELRTLQILWGPMGIGKTCAAENYKIRNNHGRTVYHRCGVGTSFGTFVCSLAADMGIVAKNNRLLEVRSKIKNLLKRGQRLLIIDELHEVFITCHAKDALRICEFIREIFDVSKCGVVLIGTNVIQKHLFDGPMAPALAQLVDRGEDPITLPPKHTKQDVISCHKHYGLAVPGPSEAEAARLLGDIVKSRGLRKLNICLRAGARWAALANETYAWKHFVQAHDNRVSLAQFTKSEEAA